MTDSEDYIKEIKKIEDKYKQDLIELENKYKQDLIELENKYKIYTSRQISSLQEKAIELKRKRVHDHEIMKLLNLTKYELYKLTNNNTTKILHKNIIEDCKNGLSVEELAAKYNYSRTQIRFITADTRNAKSKNQQKEDREKIKELSRQGLDKKTIMLITNFKKSYIYHVLKNHKTIKIK